MTVRALPLLVAYEAKASIVKAMSAELGLDARETAKALELFETGFPPLTRREWLPFLFGVSPKLLGAMAAHPDRYYRRFRLPKRSGGFREVVTPRRFLKTIQRWFLENVFSHLPVSDSVHGFVVGRSIFTNAAIHRPGRNLLVADIQEFFPSVSQDRVKRLLSDNLPYSDAVVSQIAGLCTLNGSLPQGAPTSPVLANAAFLTADRRLEELARLWHSAYSRYADDIAISGERRFSAEDVDTVEAILRDEGFVLHRGKTRIIGPGDRQLVAGVVVNGAELPPREVRRWWRATFHRAQTHPREFGDRVHQLVGIASFVNQYDPDLAKEYFEIARKLRPPEEMDNAQ